MGREVRMVPKSWGHPIREDGSFIALHESNFDQCAADWDKESAEWASGNYPDYADEESKKLTYSEWNGGRPEEEDYMPSWSANVANHYMMYETTSEGTPISPAFDTPENLATWLCNSGASSFGSRTASYEGWLRVAKGGFACSAVIAGGELKSGVEAL